MPVISASSKPKIFWILIPLLIAAAAAAYMVFRPFSEQFSGQLVKVCAENKAGCHEENAPYRNASLPASQRADDLLGRMTQAEKVGQMALIEKDSIADPNDIALYGLGGLMSGGSNKPADNTPAGWLKMVKDFQAQASRTRLAIPLLYGVDANHGHANVPGATIFPHAIGLGAADDPELARRVAAATADEILATGINWVFSPDLDIPQDYRWGRVYETFGTDPKRVSALGKAYIEGLQEADANGLKIAAGAKHFIANGATQWGSSTNKDFSIDQGNAAITEDELRREHLEPFRQAVQAGAKTVMAGLNKWNGQKVSASPRLLNDILKSELGFQGFIVSDWYGVYEKENNKYAALVRSVNAGIDMVMLPYDYKTFAHDMHQALANGDITQERLNDAVRRILIVKFETGLFDAAFSVPDQSVIGSAPHRSLAREAVRKSAVLMKNIDTLPMTKGTPKILVAGSAADNIGHQSGGWTVEWQGVDGNWIPGTSILQGIKDAVSSTSRIEYDAGGNFSGQLGTADIGIAVVGEKPYAEGWGDDPHPQLSKEDLKAIASLRRSSKKVVVVIVSGRPLDIKDYAAEWDAVVAAWLPGSEGEGIADVLFGDYPFSGKLPLEWSLTKNAE